MSSIYIRDTEVSPVLSSPFTQQPLTHMLIFIAASIGIVIAMILFGSFVSEGFKIYADKKRDISVSRTRWFKTVGLFVAFAIVLGFSFNALQDYGNDIQYRNAKTAVCEVFPERPACAEAVPDSVDTDENEAELPRDSVVV